MKAIYTALFCSRNQHALVCISIHFLLIAPGGQEQFAAFFPWMAMAGSAVCGFGLSFIFPAIGVGAVKRVPEFNRGTALGVYTAFADVSFFLVGPVAGALIGSYGYSSIWVFALVSILVALGIVVMLQRMEAK